jgi:hypothetical protein
MASFQKFNQFVQDLANGAHNLGTHTLKVMLVNSPAPAAGNSIRGNLTEITAGAGYTSGGNVGTVTVSTQTGGTYKCVISPDVVFTASGGSIGPFRYVVLYNDTQTTPVDPLIGFWDYGSSITLNDTETFTVDFDQVNGVLQIV